MHLLICILVAVFQSRFQSLCFSCCMLVAVFRLICFLNHRELHGAVFSPDMDKSWTKNTHLLTCALCFFFSLSPTFCPWHTNLLHVQVNRFQPVPLNFITLWEGQQLHAKLLLSHGGKIFRPYIFQKKIWMDHIGSERAIYVPFLVSTCLAALSSER